MGREVKTTLLNQCLGKGRNEGIATAWFSDPEALLIQRCLAFSHLILGESCQGGGNQKQQWGRHDLSIESQGQKQAGGESSTPPLFEIEYQFHYCRTPVF
jgi:hypothetical protein